jgi:hypothetical protein
MEQILNSLSASVIVFITSIISIDNIEELTSYQIQIMADGKLQWQITRSLKQIKDFIRAIRTEIQFGDEQPFEVTGLISPDRVTEALNHIKVSLGGHIWNNQTLMKFLENAEVNSNESVTRIQILSIENKVCVLYYYYSYFENVVIIIFCLFISIGECTYSTNFCL